VTGFRYLEDDLGLSSAEGLAGDEALALSVADGKAPPTLRLYSYRPSVIVGRYQNLADAVNLEECRRRGHEWNRRHTGGGTVLMGPDQVAVALVMPEAEPHTPGTVRQHLHFFAGMLADALSQFGIKSGLEGKNDLQVAGRKIAGLAISQDTDGVVFFHCSLLLGFDVELMVNVLNLSTRDLDDRGQSCFSQRMTTVNGHAQGVSFEEMKQAIVRSLASRIGDPNRSGRLPAETAEAERLCRERYQSDEWIYSARVMRRWTGTAECRTPGGNLRVYADRTGGVLDSVLVTGDYFCRNLEVAALEANLRGVPAQAEDIRSALARHGCDIVYRVPSATLADLIAQAASATGPRLGPIAMRG